MDVTTFADKAVLDELSEHWVLFKMDLTEANDANAALQEKYELPGLPTLTLVPSNGDLKGKFPINGFVTAPSLLNELNEFRKKSP